MTMPDFDSIGLYIVSSAAALMMPQGRAELQVAITQALRDARNAALEEAAKATEGWETHAAGTDYQTDGRTFWDAGRPYHQGRLDAAFSIRALKSSGAV